ncbi:MAG: phosphatase [Lawsonibacter sp.]|nr:phosphatase [Lawsonibacter sp.]
MICGIIDMGSNTIRMSIYNTDHPGVHQLIHKKETAELSAYVKKGTLSKAGMEKACDVLRQFQNILANFGVADFYVFATASLRNINNTQEAVSYLREQTGISVDVLSGEEEARLDFVGVSQAAQLDNGVLVDIGGGSTEIVEVQNGTILLASSLPVGCLNLYLNYVRAFFPRQSEYHAIRQDVKGRLMDTIHLQGAGSDLLYGVGGTVRTALKIHNLMFDQPSGNREFSYENLCQMIQMLRKSDRFALKTILRTAPDRVSTLLPGLIVLKTVARHCRSSRILVSSFGIREGYLYDRVLGGTRQ